MNEFTIGMKIYKMSWNRISIVTVNKITPKQLQLTDGNRVWKEQNGNTSGYLPPVGGYIYSRPSYYLPTEYLDNLMAQQELITTYKKHLSVLQNVTDIETMKKILAIEIPVQEI